MAPTPDEDALEGEGARVALLRHRVHVALAVAARRILEAWARGGQLGQLQQVRCCGLDRAQEGVQPADGSQHHESIKVDILIGSPNKLVDGLGERNSDNTVTATQVTDVKTHIGNGANPMNRLLARDS